MKRDHYTSSGYALCPQVTEGYLLIMQNAPQGPAGGLFLMSLRNPGQQDNHPLKHLAATPEGLSVAVKCPAPQVACVISFSLKFVGQN